MTVAAAYREQIARRLTEARARDGLAAFVGYVDLYCDNPRCVMREIHGHVKEYDSLTPARLLCPACRRQLKPHGVLTLAEQDAKDDSDARISVREQLQQARDRAAGLDGEIITLTLDDSLPRAEELVPLIPPRRDGMP